MIEPIPSLPAGLREASVRGTLIPFVGAGASRLAGCPDWSEFADGALRHFVDLGKLTYAQLAQLSQQPARVKLSIALGLQRRHNLPINFENILYPPPDGRNANPKGRRLYEALCKLGKIFVTTNYDDWLDISLGTQGLTVSARNDLETPTIRQKPTIIHRVTELTATALERPNTVIHLHGSLLEPSGMVMTTQDYISHYANDRRSNIAEGENRVLTFLEFLFSEKTVLFVGYGLAELEILEYVIGKARLRRGSRELKHFLLQGFFSHEEELERGLADYYAERGIELVPFLRDYKGYDQLIDVLEEYARIAPSSAPLRVQMLKEMETLLNG